MNMHWVSKIWSCVLFLLFTVASWAQTRTSSNVGQPDFFKVRKLIQEQMASKGTPSISVAVVRKGKILWEEGFGWADRENRVRATEHTMYYTASVTKLFTETALMILEQRKQLDVDRPVNDYLGAAKLSSPAWNPTDATVRRVANHTAGLTTYNPAHHLSMDEAISHYGVLFWPPGERFDYSNLGPIILEEVIARVSGKKYPDFLSHEVLQPLGMTRCSVGIGSGLEKYAAKRYSAGDGSLRPAAEGGVYCSAHDLARFGMFHLKMHLADQKAILSDASIDVMQNSTVDASSGGRYGFAWWIEDDRYGFRSVLSQGGTNADQAWLRLIPSEGIAVVVLSNIGHASVSRIVDEILAALLPVYGENLAKAEATVSTAKPSSTDEKLAAQALVGNWEGIIRTYRGDTPLTFSIEQSGDIHAKLGSQPETLLKNVRFLRQRMTGVMPGDLNVEDTGPGPYNLHFWLCVREGTLNGAAVTEPNPQLPYWTELKKLNQGNEQKQ